jgi:hypothetical protein
MYLDGIRDVRYDYTIDGEKYILGERRDLLLGEIEMRLIVSIASIILV